MNTYPVLLTGAGRRVELVKRFLRARDQLGLKGSVIAGDASDTAPALYFADERVRLPLLQDPSYVEALIEACRRYAVKLIVPTIDPELPLLARERERIENACGARVLVSSIDAVAICRDKVRTARFFCDCGLACPRTYSAAELDAGAYTLPLFVKPLNGSSSVNAFRAETAAQLEFFRGYVPDPIVQECVTGVEYTVDTFADFDGNVITCVPRVRLATRGGEVLKGRVEKNGMLIGQATLLTRALGAIGHITLQGILGADGVMRWLEINPRFGGGAPMSIDAGADSPKNLYRLLRGERLSYTEEFADGLTFARFDDSVVISETK